MINFTGAIKDLHDSHEKSSSNFPTPTLNPSKEINANSIPTVFSVFHPIYHTTNSNEVILISDNFCENLCVCFGNNNCHASNMHGGIKSVDTNKWYNEVNNNQIGLVIYYELMFTDDELYNEVKVFDMPMRLQCNTITIKQFFFFF